MRMMREAPRRLIWPLVCALCAFSSRAAALSAGPQIVAREGGCPGPELLRDEVDRVLRAGPPTAQAAAAPVLRVDDLGARYTVQFAGQTATYLDPERRCDERARSAAVFVAILHEHPPRGSADGATPPPAAGPGARPRPRPVWHADLEAGGAFDLAPRSGPPGGEYAGGGALRLAFGARWLAASLGLKVLSPVTLWFAALPRNQVRLLRLPLDVSLRAALRRGPCEGIGELGLLVSVALATLESPEAQQLARAAVGVHAALGLRLWPSSRVAPFLSAVADVTPVPSRLSLEGGQPFGAVPALWIGGTLGLAVRLL
jgi:hypothetical protein